MARIPESQLILPALYYMSLEPNKSISTSALIPKLRELLKPDGEDIVRLNNRNDDKFSQKVRNLKSHDSIRNKGFVNFSNGIYTLTRNGSKFLKQNFQIVQLLLENDFSNESLREGLGSALKNTVKRGRKAQVFDENTPINEGKRKKAEVQVIERSNKLRDEAIKYYTKDGKITCCVCHFCFTDFYGPEVGKGYIEIHHLKPVFKYEDEEMEQFIKDAIRNVVPVCSNCHRMIHSKRKDPLEIDEIKKRVRLNGRFSRKRFL